MSTYSFSDNARASLQAARSASHRLGHEYVGTEHIILGLLDLPQSVAVTVLGHLGIGTDALRDEVSRTVPRGVNSQPLGVELPYTNRAKRALELAMVEARELDHDQVGSEHLLLGLAREQNGIAGQILAAHGGTLTRIRTEVLRIRPAAQPGVRRTAYPINATIMLEYPDGRLTSARFEHVGDAVSHLARLMRPE